MQGHCRAFALVAVFSVAVASSNVAMEAILCPLGVVDSGQIVMPRVVVGNAGDVSADSFWAHLKIDNEMDVVVYHDSVILRGLEPGGWDTVRLMTWIPAGRDSMGASAWSWWDDDSLPEDDTLQQRFLVRVKDVAITSVNQPPPGDTLDPEPIYPQVELFNRGNQTMTFPVIFNIGPWFDTVWVVNMLAGGSRTVTAGRPWMAAGGIWLCNFTARVAGDLHPENNDTSFVLIVRGTITEEVVCEYIYCPCGVMDTMPFVPQARYGIYGIVGGTCTTYCRIEDTLTDRIVYSDEAPVMMMQGSFVVAYRPCTLRVEGPYVVTCSIGYDDQNPLNNARREPFHVGPHAEYDVLVSAILAPRSLVDSGAAIVPRAEVFNPGLYRESFPVYFRLPGGYEEYREITLDAGVYDTVSFPIWRADLPPGSYTAVAFTLLAGDLNTENDTLVRPFSIQKRDIGVSAILSPRDTVPDATMVGPSCKVTNYGNTVETFQVLFQIGLFSARETVIGLIGGNSKTVVFSDSWMSSPGIWHSRAEVIPNPADPFPDNNVMYDTFWVPGRIRHDVGVVEIVSPVGNHDTIGMLEVEATVSNCGANAETFWTFFGIFDEANARVYQDSVQTVDLAADSNAELKFRRTDINVPGFYTARCSTFLATDQNWTNNLVTGMFRIEGAGGVWENQSLPSAFGFDAVQPNPFRALAVVRFSLPRSGCVDLSAYTPLGCRVRTLESCEMAPGHHLVAWDGRDQRGKAVPVGIYCLRLVAGDAVVTRKVVKLE
jgi:hypothetical protein